MKSIEKTLPIKLKDSEVKDYDINDFQRATLNILEDLHEEKVRFEETQSAVLNILEDAHHEKERLEEMQSATLNILEDFDEEKERLQETQKATLNILEDFNAEKDKVTLAYTALQKEVAARKEAEKYRDYMAALVNSADDAIFSKTIEGIITSWNKGAEKLYGYSSKEALGQHISFLVPLGHKDEIAEFLTKIKSSVQVKGYETKRFKKNGDTVDVSLTISPIKDDNDVIVGVSSVARDITAQKITEDKLRKAHDELENRVQERTSQLSNVNLELQEQFDKRKRADEEVRLKNKELETLLYIVSHDLKEPLRGIEYFSSAVKERYSKELDSKGQDYLNRVVNAGSRMRILLQEILTISRARRFTVSSEFISGQDIIDEALSRLDTKIKETQARITVAQHFPSYKVEKTWAIQAIFNLINNALKYTKEGTYPDIEIAPYFDPDISKTDQIGIVVKDRGKGVDARFRKRIFELFQRAVSRDIEGTGAGLAIVMEVALRHEGQAWVDQRNGGGSNFIITFGNQNKNERDRNTGN